jgi:hypothetical protein
MRSELFTEVETGENDIAFSSLVSSIHDDLFLHKKTFLISHLLDKYRSFLPNDVPDIYPSAKLQAKLLGHFGDIITIQPQRGQGMSNIMFSSCLSIGDAIAAAGKLKSMLRLTGIEHELATETSQESQEHILYSAASILRHDIQSFVINNEDYPNANEVSLAIFVEKMPQSLLKFICWLIDEKAYKAASEPYTVPIDKIRKILGITESIVSLSKHTFTPFHLGLAVQLHHEFGSRGLVDNLNSHGFCASYSEVRRFLTSVALKEEDSIKEGVYVPDGIVPVCQGGCLIQEGADNIDINTETIDGKDTFHSMARAVFQARPSPIDSCMRQVSIKKSNDRTFQMTNDASSQTSCLPFSKPKVRGIPKRFPKAFEIISNCAGQMENVSEILWVILRSLSRDIENFPMSVTDVECQVIPFWTGYNSSLSEYRPEYSVVSYAPIVDAKPSDMSMVYTTMRRCQEMTKSLGQAYSIQTFDQQLYAIAKQVEWAKQDTFKTHILRLGGFHTMSCFVASISKLWGDGGLKDLLIESSVYAAGSVEQMMTGKKFNRAVRALTLVYEALSSVAISFL